jgi:hypothetical protein
MLVCVPAQQNSTVLKQMFQDYLHVFADFAELYDLKG